MFDMRQPKKLACLAAALAILLWLIWMVFRPATDRTNRAGHSPLPPATQFAPLPLEPAARHAALKRGVADAHRLAAAGNASDSLQVIDRLIGSLQAELSALPNPADHAASDRASAARSTLDLQCRALQLAKADLRLRLNEIAEAQWLQAYQTALNADPHASGRALEQLLQLAAQHWPLERFWTLLNSALPAPARAILAAHLLAYHAPDGKADPQQCARFYESLIARCIDTPVVAEGLLDRYIQELDRRNAAPAANAFLWNLLKLLPDTRLGARSALLLIAAEPADARSSLLRHLWSTYPATELAHAIRAPYLQLLSRERQFASAFQLLDDRHTIPAASTRDSLVIALADLARHSHRTPALAFSRRRIAPGEPCPALSTVHPLDLCAGLAEELTGKPLDASDLETSPSASTPPNDADPLRTSLAALLTRALEDISLDRARQILLADLRKPPSTQPFLKKPVSQPAYELAWQVNFLITAGKGIDAIRLCRQTIQTPPDRDTLLQARRLMVELLLDQQPLDVHELDRQLAALRAEEAGPTASSWNLALRTLFRRILASPPADRQTLWQQTLPNLRQQTWPLTDPSLADLDRLTQNLSAGTLSPLAVTTDLLLLARDIQTATSLQSRRVAALLAEKAWDLAIPAIQLHQILACFTQDGPFELFNRDLELARSAGMPPDRLQQLQSHPILTPSDAPSLPPIDAPLRQASQSLLQSSVNPRANALAHAFAGTTEAALRALHASLDHASATNDALDRLDDIALVLAIADASPHNAHRFAQWLAEDTFTPSPGAPDENWDDRSEPTHNRVQAIPSTPTSQPADPLLSLLQHCELKAQTLGDFENDTRHDASLGPIPTTAPFRQLTIAPTPIRRQLANAALRRWGQRAVAWGAHAISQNATPTAQAAWTLALNTQRRPESTAALAELIIDHLRSAPPDADPTDRLQILQSILPHLRTAQDRQYLHARIIALHRHEGLQLAKTLFDEGSYAECLAALDQLDKTWPEPHGAADLPTAFVRALCLIRLEKLPDAADLLSQMESWPASPEQRARALFLIGWIHLQSDDRPKAIAAFQRLLAAYPQTTFAAKAKDMLTNLE